MAVNDELARGLRAVQRVLSSEEFIGHAAGGAPLKDCDDDPEETLRPHGVVLPVEARRVEMRVRHTPPAARQRGLRGGNFEWHFQVQVGDQSWRVFPLCDAWPIDVADESDSTEHAQS